uniref:hypothetical protein n=1 Tax=Pseudomonas viridiflava TaxID=33069 RepID=UPI00197E3C82
GVSQLFGLWSFIVDRVEQGKTKKLKSKIEKFYALLREDPHSNTFVSEYKKSMSSGTKEVTQRNRRRQALIGYVESV